VPEALHGGTDAGAPPSHDFSTNANALGPDPHALSAVRAADPGPYPDPAYTALRRALGAAHGTSPEAVVVGAGASELILRAVRAHEGPVLVLEPCFGEYARAARVEGRPLVRAATPAAFLEALPGAAVAFVASPDSPRGRPLDPGFAAALGARRPDGAAIVADLAYAPLAQARIVVPHGAWRLHSPGKACGLTGLRAGYLLADPAGAAALTRRAPAWVLSAGGEALLRASLGRASRAWVERSRRLLWAWRDRLARRIAAIGRGVEPGAANYLLAEVGDAAAVTRGLRARGIRVRDASSFGLPGWLRLSAQPPEAQDALLAALSALLGRRT
jgi:histidinol-phosphate aminotransferase